MGPASAAAGASGTVRPRAAARAGSGSRGRGRRRSSSACRLPPPMPGNPAMSVDAADLERSLAFVQAQAAGAREGVFGPESAIWQVDREARVFLGAGRALLMQLAHPW